jgi:protein-S-isoprenylcysteine O-methyltransferase Ste14
VPVWSSGWNQIVAYALICIAALLIIASAVTLGDATRLGIPDEKTVLKHSGIYRFSRNPMYVGFNLLTIAAMVYSLHPVILAIGIYSIFVYHLIIRGEERFLQARFGDAYRAYCAKVRRYI